MNVSAPKENSLISLREQEDGQIAVSGRELHEFLEIGAPYPVSNEHSRSPLHVETPLTKLKDTKIKIYARIHDGCIDEVLITHSLKFYNKLAKETDEETFSQEELIYLLEKGGIKVIKREMANRGLYFIKALIIQKIKFLKVDMRF